MIKMKKRVSLVEMKIRVKDFKNKISMIKNDQELRIWYQPELLNRIPFMGSKEYLNLLYSLETFEKLLNENNDMKKFKYRLWNISLRDDRKLLFHSVNQYLKEEIFLNIDLETRERFILTNK